MNIVTYNIQSGGNARLPMALEAMKRMNVDVGVFTETKLVAGKHTVNSSGYKVVATEAKSAHQGGVALFFRDAEDWHIEGVKPFGPNVIAATIVSGNWRRSIIGVYIPPSEEDGKTIEFVRLAAHKMRKNPIILVGDLNVDLLNERRRRNHRMEETADLVALLDLKLINGRFRRKRKCGVWTWWQRREGAIVKATTDYILFQEANDATSYSLKTPRFDTDHRLVKAGLKARSVKEHRRYVKKRTEFPVTLIPTGADANEGDKILGELREAAKRLDEDNEEDDLKGDARSWISEKSFRLMSRKAMAKRFGMREEAQRLRDQLKDSVEEDRKQRYSATAKDLEKKLDEGDIKGAFTQAQKWYRKRNEASKPTFEDEEDTRKEFEELHTAVDPEGESIPVHVSFEINDNPPEEQEVKRNLKDMHSGKSGGPTEIRVEHLKEWMNGAEDEKNPRYQDEWKMVLDLVGYCFTNNAARYAKGVRDRHTCTHTEGYHVIQGYLFAGDSIQACVCDNCKPTSRESPVS